MAVNITEKERRALLDAVDFISTHADGALDYKPFAQMKRYLMTLFYKAKKDEYIKLLKKKSKTK